jgi:hypothetical protein
VDAGVQAGAVHEPASHRVAHRSVTDHRPDDPQVCTSSPSHRVSPGVTQLPSAVNV